MPANGSANSGPANISHAYTHCPVCGGEVVIENAAMAGPRWHGFDGRAGHMFEFSGGEVGLFGLVTYDELVRRRG